MSHWIGSLRRYLPHLDPGLFLGHPQTHFQWRQDAVTAFNGINFHFDDGKRFFNQRDLFCPNQNKERNIIIFRMTHSKRLNLTTHNKSPKHPILLPLSIISYSFTFLLALTYYIWRIDTNRHELLLHPHPFFLFFIICKVEKKTHRTFFLHK